MYGADAAARRETGTAAVSGSRVAEFYEAKLSAPRSYCRYHRAARAIVTISAVVGWAARLGPDLAAVGPHSLLGEVKIVAMSRNSFRGTLPPAGPRDPAGERGYAVEMRCHHHIADHGPERSARAQLPERVDVKARSPEPQSFSSALEFLNLDAGR